MCQPVNEGLSVPETQVARAVTHDVTGPPLKPGIVNAAGALYLLILSLFLALPALADDSADTYTLSQAFLDTIARDARIRAAENRIAEARERLTEANSLRRQHQARAQRIEARSRYRVARAQLARLTGADHDDLAPTSLAGLELATPANLDYALNQAEGRSPSLLRARMRLEETRIALLQILAELNP